MKYEVHIKMYCFQPQKYLPKNQGSRSTGQKENSHSPQSWRRPGHTPWAGHDGVLHYDVLPPGNHLAAVLHAKVISWGFAWPHTLFSSCLRVALFFWLLFFFHLSFIIFPPISIGLVLHCLTPVYTKNNYSESKLSNNGISERKIRSLFDKNLIHRF